MKYFSVPEAEAMIPELEKIYAVLRDIAEKAQAKAEKIRQMENAAKKNPAQYALEKAQLQFLAGTMTEWFQKIVDLGALPKGLDPALVDFPHRLGSKEVYLCWQLGEKTITHYHGLEDGFSGRQALPKAPR